MSSIRFALEKLDNAVGKLDSSVSNVECALQDYVPVEEVTRQVNAAKEDSLFHDPSGNVVGVDFVARRLDKAIETVECLLRDEG